VRRVTLGGWPLPPEALRGGWHPDDGAGWRWTDGVARIALPCQSRATVLRLHVAQMAHYWAADTTTPAQRQTR
jgi:hypothetical protein